MLTPDDSSPVPAWRRYLAYATVALMPMSVDVQRLLKVVDVPRLLKVKGPVYFSPLDFLLPILFLLMLADLVAKRPWARFRSPPVAVVLWAGLAVLSCVWSEGFPALESLKTCARGALNPMLFGVAAVWVFQNLPADAAEYRRVALVLGASFSVCVLIALKQYVGPPGLPYDPTNPTQDLGGVTNVRLGGWYDFRGVLGAQVALLAPAAAAFALLDKDAAVRWAAGGAAAVALCVTVAAGGFAGASLGVLAVATAYAFARSRLTGLTAVAILLAVVAVVLPRLPRHNDEVLFRGFAFFADDAGARKPTARLRRAQAELSLLAAPSDPRNEESRPNWVLGVGAGRYQKQINGFYYDPVYSKPGRPTDDEAAYDMEADERFTFGFLETVVVELGLPGLVAVLFLFGAWILSAHGAFVRLSANAQSTATPAGGTEPMLALAAFGSGCGALVVSVFANPVIRGVGGSFAFFFALALCAKCWSDALPGGMAFAKTPPGSDVPGAPRGNDDQTSPAKAQ
ncbi:MAG: hypothetical protein NTW87_21840 [Planctomycetota bacterium]|nr:hypothetical protein [Planctomycetota bacterium]